MKIEMEKLVAVFCCLSFSLVWAIIAGKNGCISVPISFYPIPDTLAFFGNVRDDIIIFRFCIVRGNMKMFQIFSHQKTLAAANRTAGCCIIISVFEIIVRIEIHFFTSFRLYDISKVFVILFCEICDFFFFIFLLDFKLSDALS